MIPKECKRLAEVEFPIAEVSRQAAREKSIRKGHPSTLHLWWARRPLASSRAVLMALLMPDPCDPYCPDEFKIHARELLLGMRGRPSGWNSVIQTDEGLRQILLKFIADFANWDNAAKAEYLGISRGLVKAAHPGETPLVVDPFAGGGSIPLEALRLGCETFASDLNPVACLILKVMLEDVPRHETDIAEELLKAGTEIEAQAERELTDLYPREPDGSTPVAYLWARTVRCEAPNCGAEIPLMKSMWLCRKPKKKWALCPSVVREQGCPPRVDLDIFQPKDEKEVENGTVSRARATCLCCRAVLPPERVRSQLAAQRGGSDSVFDEDGNRIGGARMTAVVTLKPGRRGQRDRLDRQYRLPTELDYRAVLQAKVRVKETLEEWVRNGEEQPSPVPDEPMPPIGTLGFRVQRYGMLQWGDLFTARQKAALVVLGTKTSNIPASESRAHKPLLALAVSRFADDFSSLSRWMDRETPAATFTRHALPILWDFCEIIPFDDASWSYLSSVKWVANSIQALQNLQQGQTHQADATDHPLPDQAANIWFTDPPYYDAIPYADLSDFFLVWLKRILPRHPLLADPFNPENPLSPKRFEAVLDETKEVNGRVKNRLWFEETMGRAFEQGRRVLTEEGIGAVVFAHKTTEGWEALLSGMISGGWTITGSWPIATERPGRPRAFDSAALATSVHLICRPRPDDAEVGEWAGVLRELPNRVGDWMQRLQKEGIRGADLVFACIGPALEIYSRYSAVETPEGRGVALPEYLERVWEVVAREALEQILGTAEAQARNGAAGALEEDARLTALFLWTLQSTDDAEPAVEVDGDGDEVDADEIDGEEEAPRQKTTGFSMPFDVARRFAQPLGIHLEEWENRITQTQKGVVRLRSIGERAKELFGEAGADSMADEIEASSAAAGQLHLFPEEAPTVRGRARRGRQAAAANADTPETTREPTTLDRLHAGMLLQASGRTEALRTLIRAEQDRGPDFLRLSNALSALYPRGSEEKRLLDGMLLAAPR